MPGKSDEQAAVMSEVGRPPILRIRLQRLQVGDERVEVERLERFGVVERAAERVGLGGMLVQDVEIELIRPPVSVALRGIRMQDRALADALVFDLGIQGCLRLED